MWSCDLEKLSIPVEAHHEAQSSEFFLFSAKKIKRAVIFYLLANPAETAYLSIRDGELSNAVRLVEFRQRKVVVHTILGVGQIWTACDARLRNNSSSHPFWLVQTCPNLSEPVRNTVPMYAPSRIVIFCTFECSYSSVLCPILVKLHSLTRLIESFPMVCGLWRCI